MARLSFKDMHSPAHCGSMSTRLQSTHRYTTPKPTVQYIQVQIISTLEKQSGRTVQITMRTTASRICREDLYTY